MKKLLAKNRCTMHETVKGLSVKIIPFDKMFHVKTLPFYMIV